MATTTPTTATARADRTIAMMLDSSILESNGVVEDNAVVSVVLNKIKKNKVYTYMRTTLLNDMSLP